MYTLRKETDELKQTIRKKMQCSYIEKYIQKPFIDDNKLAMLSYIYKDIDIPEKMKKRYVTTIMLVQIALDTHELISSDDETEMNETEKQLSVLAGDYYSGLYYLLLSEIEDINMIKTLATAIQQINEQKMKLFYEDVASFEELMSTIKSIETLLFTEVAYMMNRNSTLTPIIVEVLYIHKLMREKEQVRFGKFSYIENYVKNHVDTLDYKNTLELIDKELTSSKEQLERLLVQLPYHLVLFKNEIRSNLGLSYNKSVAEEG